MTATVEAGDSSRRTLSATKQRIVEAALRLFGDHGISGTSLQMIADAIGVTKAAVYHQFRTKDEIIVAAMEEPVRRLRAAVEAAGAEKSSERALEVLITQVVDLAIESREIVRNLQGDPIMARFLSTYEPFQTVMGNMYRLLAGNRPNTRTIVRAAMVSAALASTAVHPLVADLDDRSLREHMVGLAMEAMSLPITPGTDSDRRTDRIRGGASSRQAMATGAVPTKKALDARTR
jgi:AcrR family transcriptional regulator